VTRLLREQGVTAPAGFRAAGIAAGIKASGKPDLALVFNEGPDYAAAGVFTSNQVKAAPVQWSQQVLKSARLRAVILNSGGANACTGPGGFADTHTTAEAVAAALSKWGTDTVPKQVALHHKDNWTLGGMAKGAGMMAPSLATMLVVLTTDAKADAQTLEKALRRAAALTFDRLDIDGSCSTNDTVLLLSSGASEITPRPDELEAAVLAACEDLCAQLQADAEGVTKRVTITVTGAGTDDDALVAARIIARDSLVKTALFGSDPNWGRVLAAVGMVPFEIDPDRITVSFNGSPVFSAGTPMPGARDVDLSGPDISVTVELNQGAGSATVRTTDLSHAYVEENSAYSS